MPVKKRSSQIITAKAKNISMLLCDVDGVLTDGGLYYAPDGTELKRFDAQDGYGIRRAQRYGVAVGFISGRNIPAVEHRARQLEITELHQGELDKLSVCKDIMGRNGLIAEQIAFIGDEIFDVPLMEFVGLGCAPHNARPEAKQSADYVTKSDGGHGAVREVIDLILTAKNGKV